MRRSCSPVSDELWTRGVDVDWAAFAEPYRRRVGLPGYPFQRQRHWIEPPAANMAPAEISAPPSASASRPASLPEQWTYVPVWQPQSPPDASPLNGHWLLLSEGSADVALADALLNSGCRVSRVARGARCATLAPDRYAVRPQERDDYRALLDALPEPPCHIAWLWTYGAAVPWLAEDHCYALHALLQALDGMLAPPRLSVVATGIAAVTEGEGRTLAPELGTLSGFIATAAQEFPALSIRLVDALPPALADPAAAAAVLALCCEQGGDPFVASRGRRCWRLAHAKLPLPATPAVKLRQNGVYLITGGLGGIGLTLAQDLANACKASLVLFGRTELPPESNWRSLVADPDCPATLRETLRRLVAIRDSGSELLIMAADVAVRDQVERVIVEARARFGPLHGVIHAAGIADGALLARQTRDGMARVLAPKVAGTRLLAEVLADEPLDFCLLCAALSATTGAQGQAAYTAANSFLEHFALAAPVPWPVVAVGWDAWREVGMASRHGAARVEMTGRELQHPLLRTRRDASDGRVIYQAPLRAADWILSEHPFSGQVLLPGTAYLELAVAAARDLFGTARLDMRNVSFLRPLLLDPDQEATLEVTLAPDGEQQRFEIQSRMGDAVEPHATGWLAPLVEPPPQPIDVAHADRCELGGTLLSRLGNFGPHWHCLTHVSGRERELASLALDDAYATECESFLMHPALLDVATGFAVLDQHYDAALLPFGYGRLRLHAPLPPQALSELRALRQSDDGLSLDLRLIDPHGRVLAEIDDYHFRRASRLPAFENLRLVLHEPGRLESLRAAPCARQAPGPGEVEVEVYAVGLNFKEVLYAAGMLPEAESLGGRFGLECAGRISRVGEGVRGRRPGEGVVAYAAGCMQSYAVVPQAQVMPLPAGLSFIEGATLPVAFITAYCALVKQARLGRGETVLIHAAAGGVGLAAVEIARSLGAQVLATAGSPRKRAFLQKLGVAGVFDSRSAAFADPVRARTSGRGVDVVLNSLSGELMRASLALVAPGGRFIELGVRDMYAGGTLDLRHFANGLGFTALNVGPGMPGFSDLFREVLGRVEAGVFAPLPNEVFPLAASSKAFEHMARARHIGKVVIELRADAGRRAGLADSFRRPGLSCAEGADLFRYSLAAGQPRIIVSTEDLGRLLAHTSAASLPEAETRRSNLVARPSLSIPYAAPQGEAEREMAALLERLLGVDRLGRDDDFFELGGDSLLGTQFVSNINRSLGTRLTLRDLFEQPRIAALAARLYRTAVPDRITRPPTGIDDVLTGGGALSRRSPTNRPRPQAGEEAALIGLPAAASEDLLALLREEDDVRSLFEAPSVEGLARRLDEGERARPAVARRPRATEIPLSFAQRRLWFLDRLEGPNPTYTIPIALRLAGALDPAALEAALGDVVARHESLRTLFPDIEGSPRQLILEPSAARPSLAVVQVTEDSLGEALAVTARQGFDLASEPPLRAHLFVLGAREHVLLLVLHHIAGDGWSLAPLARDLAGAYRARCRGLAPELPCLPVQYADYTLWQYEVLGREDDPDSAIVGQLAFWTAALKGLPDQLDLPTDRPRPGGVELSRRQRSYDHCPCAARAPGCACAREPSEPVYGIAGGAGGAAHATGRRHRYCDRQPDCGAHRERARRSRGLLRQHFSAAHRHRGQSKFPRSHQTRARHQSGCLQPSGAALRASCGGAQSDPIAGQASAVPSHAGVPERGFGQPRSPKRRRNPRTPGPCRCDLRPLPRSHPHAGRAIGQSRIQRRPVRSRHGRSHGGTSPTRVRERRCRSGPAHRPA